MSEIEKPAGEPQQPAARLRGSRASDIARLMGGGNIIDQSENADFLDVDQTGEDAHDMGSNVVSQKGGDDAANLTLASSLTLKQGDGDDKATAFLIDRSSIEQGLGGDELRVMGAGSLTVKQGEGDDRIFVDLPVPGEETTAEKKVEGARVKKTVKDVLGGVGDAALQNSLRFNSGKFDGGEGNDTAFVEGDKLMFVPRKDGSIEAWVSGNGQPEGENAIFTNYETISLAGHADENGRRLAASYHMQDVAAVLKEMGVKMDNGVEASDETFQKSIGALRKARREKGRGGVS